MVGVAAFGDAKSDWFRSFLPLPEQMPSRDTFDCVFAMLDPNAFEECFEAWVRSLGSLLAGVVNLDGKRLRRSFDTAGKRAAT